MRHPSVLTVLATALAMGIGASSATAQYGDSPAWEKPKDKPKAPAKPAKPDAPEKKKDAAPPVEPPREETEAERLKREAQELFNPGARLRGKGAQTTGEDAGSGWMVALGVFRGEERDSASRVMLRRVQTEGGLPNAYVVKRNEAVVVGVGSFAGADDPGAEEELKRVQELVIGGMKPYARAFLAPPAAGEMQGQMPQYNLVRANEMFGEKAVQTVQVGVYGRDDLRQPKEEDLKEVRRAAEQAAYRLRQEGEQAFYYHGATRSMVTIGVFDVSDFDPQVPNFKSEALRGVQKRFPYNLYNGAAIKERRKGAPERLQPSSLVAIPNK